MTTGSHTIVLPIVGVGPLAPEEVVVADPTPTEAPTEEPTGRGKPDMVVNVKASWYNPALGGPNCFNFVNGKCISRMASGKNWEKYLGKAVACPPDFPFGTVFVVKGREWVCLDRGGAIKRLGKDTVWLDFLNKGAVFPFGSIVKGVEVHLPKGH